MKRTLLLTSLALSLSLSATAEAGLWEKMTTLDQETVKSTSSYLVEASGWDVRVVEWTPKENPNVRCMFVGGSKKGGATCYPVAK